MIKFQILILLIILNKSNEDTESHISESSQQNYWKLEQKLKKSESSPHYKRIHNNESYKIKLKAKSNSRSRTKILDQEKEYNRKSNFMKTWTEIKVCCFTNDIKCRNYQEPFTSADMTRFYKDLVQSDFSDIVSPATFSKEPRFKETYDRLPGPGYYNPKKTKLSNYSKSKIYNDILSKTDYFGNQSYFNENK